MFGYDKYALYVVGNIKCLINCHIKKEKRRNIKEEARYCFLI